MNIEKSSFYNILSHSSSGGVFDVVADSFTIDIEDSTIVDLENKAEGGAAFYVKYTENKDYSREFDCKNTKFDNITGDSS